VGSDESGVLEEIEQLVSRQIATAAGIFEGRIGKGALPCVELEDSFFDCVARDQSMQNDGAILPDAVGAVGGLLLNCWIPPRVEEEHMVRGGEVEAGAARSKGQEHNWGALVALEGVDDRAAVTRRSVQAQSVDSQASESGLNEIKQARPLREDQRLMTVGNGFFETLEEGFEFRGRAIRGLLAGNETRVARRLAEAKQGLEGRHDITARAQSLDDIADRRSPDRVIHGSFFLRKITIEHDLRKRR
jgi:hypothetical protein